MDTSLLNRSTAGGAKTRQSGVDLLRIFAILMICIFHANQTAHGMDAFSEVGWFSRTISNAVLSQFGMIGNLLFIICSSYYLADSSRSSGKKALWLLLDSTLINTFPAH